MGQKYALFDKEGFPKAFYDDEIHENIPQEAIKISEQDWLEFINNQGLRKWNFQKSQIEIYMPPLPTLDEIKSQKQKELLLLQKQRLQDILNQYGYNSIGDVIFYANKKDKEAKLLAKWYEIYDNLIWQYIDNNLQEYQDVDKLLTLNMKDIEEKIYQDSINTSPLP